MVSYRLDIRLVKFNSIEFSLVFYFCIPLEFQDETLRICVSLLFGSYAEYKVSGRT